MSKKNRVRDQKVQRPKVKKELVWLQHGEQEGGLGLTVLSLAKSHIRIMDFIPCAERNQ